MKAHGHNLITLNAYVLLINLNKNHGLTRFSLPRLVPRK